MRYKIHDPTNGHSLAIDTIQPAIQTPIRTLGLLFDLPLDMYGIHTVALLHTEYGLSTHASPRSVIISIYPM